MDRKVFKSKHVPENDLRVVKQKETWQKVVTGGIIFGEGVKSYDIGFEMEKDWKKMIAEAREYLSEIGENHPNYAGVANNIKDRERRLDEIVADKGKTLRREFTKLSKDLSFFISNAPSSVNLQFVQDRLRSIFLNDEIRKESELMFGGGLRDFSPKLLLEKINSGQLSAELMYQIAKKNLEIVDGEREKFVSFAEKTRQEFKISVEKAVAEGKLPSQALLNLHRVDSVTFQYEDFLSNPNSLTLGRAGTHGKISANGISMTDLSTMRHVIFHELTHEISGKKYSVETTTYGEWETDHVNSDKVGLRVGSNSNVWINEAVTETISLMLSGYSSGKKSDYGNSMIYVSERMRLDVLLQKSEQVGGNLWRIALDAYFENIDSSIPIKDKAKNFAKLVREINKLDGQYGWSKIENSFRLKNDIVPYLGFPLTSNYGMVKEYLGKYRVYKVKMEYGKNTKARIAREYYFVATSDEDFNDCLERLKKMELKREGFKFHNPEEVFASE